MKEESKGKTRQELIKERLWTKDFQTKKEWWGMEHTILTNEEIKKEPLVVRKAYAIEYTTRYMPIAIRDYELIVGVPNTNSAGFGREFVDFTLPEEKEYALKTSCMTYKQYWDSHPANYAKLLARGIVGIKEDIYEQMNKETEKVDEGIDTEKMELYRAMLIALDAVVEFAHRYSELCVKTAAECEDPVRKKELLEMAQILLKVPENPATGFHEALQSMWLLHTVFHSCMEMMPVGRTDQYMYPYYQMDIESGKITKEYARELLTCFLSKFTERTQLNKEHWETNHTTAIDEAIGGADPEEYDKFSFMLDNTSDYNFGTDANHFLQNMIIGGCKPDGTDGTNDLTYMILEQTEYLNTVSPVMSVRINDHTPKDLLRLIARILANGRGEPTIYNEDNIIKGLVAKGIPIEDARDFCNDGCWEVLIQAKTVFTYEHVHTLKILEYFMMRGRSLVSGEQEWRDCGDPSEYATFDEFYEAFMKEVKQMQWDVVNNHFRHKNTRYRINPSVLLSTLTEDCIARGKDYTNKGGRYTFYGLIINSFSHTVDSLAAIKKFVYEDKAVTMDELTEAMKHNFEGKEALREMLVHRAPKYGNADPYVDGIAKRLMKDFADNVEVIEKTPGEKDIWPEVRLVAGIGTFENYVQFGRECGASADGRKYMESLSSNYSPSLGLDVEGPTAALKSATYPDILPYYTGGPVDLGVNANDIQGEEGIERLLGVIQAFRELGGNMMTVQVLNVETLKDAQEHPDKYPNLRVRLGGLSVYFTQLVKPQQDVIIARADR